LTEAQQCLELEKQKRRQNYSTVLMMTFTTCSTSYYCILY
jgi:hypothetical protein